MKRLIGLLSLIYFCSTSVNAQSSLSEASVGIPIASGVVVIGSLLAIHASANVIVKSVEVVADGVVIVLGGASEMASTSVKLSTQAAADLSVAAGSVVEVIAVSTGHILVASGKTIAFIPNEIGNSLLHHSEVS